ncbi:excision nuclease subunit B [Candidatus Xenohaliotis californiensis]|uniref:UvrABC system protein B n=1 Tax=Candidatus Xenohaliotis californiensis TaxID=84677 RepID=A0ABP0EXK7_9RICK|nr:excision nuclease subunit B [Candidatus Xenohaliotis californiensis]
MYKINTKKNPAGDQPSAIAELSIGIKSGKQEQLLFGVTGSGKTLTMAHVIANSQKPALIMAHNKTLAAQIYEEMKDLFPNNAVEYFVSYYDYYQPEAYIARTDTFIEKDALINEKIDTLRHSATRALLERRDVIVIASVSCIYGLGAPELYLQASVAVDKKTAINCNDFIKKLVDIQYTRNDTNLKRGTFRIRGDVIDIFPSHYENTAWRLYLFDDEVEEITEFTVLTGEITKKLDSITIFANTHYVIPRPTIAQAIELIKCELRKRIAYFHNQEMFIEENRINQRTMYDLEMILETGTCKGIENYSHYFSGKKIGQAPPTLIEYLPKDALIFVDESHITVPQIRAMYNGDFIRKKNLINHGFRLPSAFDNRPLKFTEWEDVKPQTIYVSATPGSYEMEKTNGIYTEQTIRPTGLVDPKCFIRPTDDQIDNLISECQKTIEKNMRILVTVLTKKMAEHLSNYMQELNIKAVYLHSDTENLERVKIINSLRKGAYDILIGVNLLREGLDIPECGMVAILDADKEGFLRSEVSLIQTIGRAARNVNGTVIMYADKVTKSMQKALDETSRRRNKQQNYNKKYNITPQTIQKKIHATLEQIALEKNDKQKKKTNLTQKEIKKIEKQMLAAAKKHDFEKAIELKRQIESIK